MTETGDVRSNPLYGDAVLFDMFMAAVDWVVSDPEIKGALEEFRLSPHTLRGSMVTAAFQVLNSAPGEFAAYEAARRGQDEDLMVSRGAPPVLEAIRVLSLGPMRSAERAEQIQRKIGRWLALCGVLFAFTGIVSISAWPRTEPLLWSGAAMLGIAALMHGMLWLSRETASRLLIPGTAIADAATAVDEARNRLMAALTRDEFLAQARIYINTVRQDQFGHAYSVASIAGLSETYDGTYQVATDTATELAGLLTRLDGASIGVAGPRGSGKSMLIRGYCEGALDSGQEGSLGAKTAKGGRRLALPAGGDLRCMVSAPVDYAARDFVLHLFATFCRTVIRRRETRPRPASWPVAAPWRRGNLWRLTVPIETVLFFGILAAILVHWQRPIAGHLGLTTDWVFAAGVAAALVANARIVFASAHNARLVPARIRSVDNGRALAATARRHLVRVRYLQTRTSGWSGTLGLPAGGGGLSLTSARAEQPLSYPEIVSEFREFARDVAADLHRNGGRVFIGIDELDKIGAPEQAERFLNEIKGIFGIPHVYFMVSVSDDALTAFERRGLPLRDAFDSSFDEIIHVGQLSYAESRRLLYRRIIGITEPYVALCHCLAGGLARDLIRAARQVTRAAQTLGSASRALPTDQDEVTEVTVGPATAYQLLRPASDTRPPVLSTICAAVIGEELRRKTRAVSQLATTIAPGQARDLHNSLSNAARYLAPGEPAIKIVDTLSQPAPDESAPVTALRIDLTAYAYYCATLQDIFTDDLDTEQIIKATTTTASPGSFDALSAARQAFTLDPYLAWRSITEFRQAWALETRDPATGEEQFPQYRLRAYC